MSTRDSAPVARLGELYRDGGLREVRRGIRDYVLHDTSMPVHRLVTATTLSVNGVSVTFAADSREALWRGYGHGELEPMSDFLDHVGAGDVVWDVGANIGSYALLAAAVGADVVAFEPGPQARASLVTNAKLNDAGGQINATPYALADYDGDGMLLPANRSGVRELAPDGDGGDTVPVRQGDSLTVPAPDVVKIDVEGAEVAVCDGMAETLAEVRAAYVEVHDGVAPQEVSDRLAAAGLAVTKQWKGEGRNLIVKATR